MLQKKAYRKLCRHAGPHSSGRLALSFSTEVTGIQTHVALSRLYFTFSFLSS